MCLIYARIGLHIQLGAQLLQLFHFHCSEHQQHLRLLGHVALRRHQSVARTVTGGLRLIAAACRLPQRWPGGTPRH